MASNKRAADKPEHPVLVVDEPESVGIAEEELNLFRIARRANGGGDDVGIRRRLGGDEGVQHSVVGGVLAVEEEHPIGCGGLQAGATGRGRDDIHGDASRVFCQPVRPPDALVPARNDGDSSPARQSLAPARG